MLRKVLLLLLVLTLAFGLFCWLNYKPSGAKVQVTLHVNDGHYIFNVDKEVSDGVHDGLGWGRARTETRIVIGESSKRTRKQIRNAAGVD